MAPQYNVTLLTQVGKEAGVKLQQVIKSAATHLWSHGAVVSDVRPWGQRELAYRIRRQGTNHYNAQYTTMSIYCSPPVLKTLEATLRTNNHVLRHMTLKADAIPKLDKATRAPFKEHRSPEPEDLAPDAIEAAKLQYRNLVMQRVFEGRSKQELIADLMARHRWQNSPARSATPQAPRPADAAPPTAAPQP